MEQLTHTVTISQNSGSHHEIGQQLGVRAKERFGPRYIDNALEAFRGTPLYQALGMNFDLNPSYIEEVFPIAEEVIGKVHSQLLDEIKGFAQGLGEDYRRLLTFLCNFGNETGCSQFFLNGYLARNYDDSPNAVENEFLLIRPTGSLISFGASTGYIERLDGINEKGLSVSLTFGAGYLPIGHGIGSAMFSRIVLDIASTVEEALEIFNKAPYVTPNNVMVADTSGQAVVIEQSAGKHRIRRVENGPLVCANSYLDPQMRDQQKIKNATTSWREQRMKRINLGNQEEMMDLLTADFPKGLFEPYFTDGLGTLWSVIYHPETRGIYLATGGGESRKEVRFNLNDQSTFTNLPETLKTQVTNVSLRERILQYRRR